MTTADSYPESAEWLEADGLGGFASGTVGLIRTRRHHAALLVSLSPPTDRIVLVNGFDVWVETPAGSFGLSAHRYLPDVVHPDGRRHLVSFTDDPWPRWTFRLPDGTTLIHEITVPREHPVALASWRIAAGSPRPEWARLLVRPLLSCRDAHALHQANGNFRFDADEEPSVVRWHPYLGIPGVTALFDGEYRHDPHWYHGFLYAEEQGQGIECSEDLASPGSLHWDLLAGAASLVLTTDSSDLTLDEPAGVVLERMREAERARRGAYPSRLHRSAEAFLVRRGSGRTVLAGYPRSTDWGRDTFVSLRGLCLSTGRLDDARQILLGWTEHVADGLLPNFFPERLDEPPFNSVDAPLWYIVAVHEYRRAMHEVGRAMSHGESTAIREAVRAILDGFVAGTRFGIRIGEDGLLAAGEPGTPLSWMDAHLGEWAVTPRVGKAVEIQALWLNALQVGASFSTRWDAVRERGSAAFLDRFWDAEGGYLNDVVDVDHVPGTVDRTLRPNQVFAVGGLPFPLLGGSYARRVVDVLEARLWTPLGLRSLAPEHPAYVGHAAGTHRERIAVAHQGPAWPWLLGAFVDAWVRVRGGTDEARREARERFLQPLLHHLHEAGLFHVSEMADGDAPHTPRGSPFQAWSLGELLRLRLDVLREDAAPSAPSASGSMVLR